jgi:hypothetical protein
MPSIAKLVQVGTIAALMCGCSGATLRSPQTVPKGNMPPMLRPAAAGGGGVSRTICRTSSAPAGYVITDYPSSTTCASTAGKPYNAMRVEDVSKSPIGTVMLICSNQRRPSDWDYTMGDVGTTSQCPRDPGDNGTSSTVVEIVRHRGGIE